MDEAPDDGPPPPSVGTRTARSKFLEVVKGAAEGNHLELVVDPDGPNSGYGYVQKPNSFTNLYAFHFEFGDTFAVFYLGTQSAKALDEAQRKQVDYKDGQGMELVLREIREKIAAAAEEVFPSLSSLSAPSKMPTDEQAKKAMAATASNAGGAAVWGQDEMSMAKYQFRYNKAPRKSYLGVILSVVLIVALVLAFAPLLNKSSGITTCHDSSCQLASAYYQSPVFSALRVGGVYVPQTHGWGTFGMGTLQPANGTPTSGIGLSKFFIVW